MKINGSLIFDASSSSEIQNLRLEKVSSNPTYTAADAGRLIYNTTSGVMYIGVGGSTNAFVALATGGNAAALQIEVDAIETSLGSMVDSSGVFQGSVFQSLNSTIWPTAPTSLTDALDMLSDYVSGADTLAELKDVTITGPLQSGDVLQYNGTAWVDRTLAEAGIQAKDAGLDALATGGTGIVSMNGDTVAFRTLTAPAAGITITDGDGVAGNPTFALANDLAAVEGLTGAGYMVRTADNAAAVRSIESGVSGTIVVTNGDGVSGNTALNMQTLTISDTDVNADFLKFTYDTFGRVTGTAAVATADITGLVDSVYVNVSGDTMTGSLNMGGSYTVTGLAAPTAASDAVNKAYADALVAGLSWKDAVRVASTGNIDLSSAPTTIDGVTLTNGDRVLVKDQTASEQNGIYVFNGSGSAMTRASDMDAGAEFDGAAVFVMEGTQAGSGWTETATVAAVGTDPVSFSQFTGGALYTWGTGLAASGNTINVNLGAGIAQLPSDEVGIDLYSGTALILTDDGTTPSTTSSAQLALLLNGSTLTQSASGLKIAAGGVTEVEINSSALNSNGGLVGGSGTKLGVNVDGSTLEIASNVVRVKDDGIVTAKILDGNVTNAKLANSTITVSDGTVTDAVALGETLVFAGGDGITTAVTGNQVAISVDFADIQLDDLQDVAASHVDGNVLVSDGTNWVNQKVYHLYTSGAPATSHTVTHNLGAQFCNVTVVDSNNEVVIPQSITFTSTSALTVTFNTSIDCKVVVMGIA